MLAIVFRALNSLALNVLEGAQVSLSLEALELKRGDGGPQGDGIAGIMAGEWQRGWLIYELRRLWLLYGCCGWGRGCELGRLGRRRERACRRRLWRDRPHR